jgi:hypothetical protein
MYANLVLIFSFYHFMPFIKYIYISELKTSVFSAGISVADLAVAISLRIRTRGPTFSVRY